MVKMSLEYKGELRCVAEHGPSKSRIETDAPADNHGKAERFSPTDLIGASLMSCMATTTGIVALRKGWKVEGMKIQVEKEMSQSGPRRVVRLPVEVWMPVALSPEDRIEAEQTIRNCPTVKSIHPDIDVPITIHWPT